MNKQLDAIHDTLFQSLVDIVKSSLRVGVFHGWFCNYRKGKWYRLFPVNDEVLS